MAERAEMLEAALKVYPEGLALLDLEDRVVELDPHSFQDRIALAQRPGREIQSPDGHR